MILVTGATGKLGSFIVEGLLRKGVAPSGLAVLARSEEKASAYSSRGIEVRVGDYSDPASLEAAFAGVDKLMFVSSSDFGDRRPAHRNVVAAAKKAGVPLVVYTSILNADTSSLGLARDHLATERALEEAGLRHVFLRNGWYFDNYTDNLASTLEFGAILGAAGNGRYAMATREDFAAAAVAVLTHPADQAGKAYELGGGPGVTLAELAAEVSAQSGKHVQYVDLPAAEYAAKLEELGLPAAIASLLADSDAGAKNGDLSTTSKDLETLIGRPVTSLAEAVRAGLARLG